MCERELSPIKKAEFVRESRVATRDSLRIWIQRLVRCMNPRIRFRALVSSSLNPFLGSGFSGLGFLCYGLDSSMRPSPTGSTGECTSKYSANANSAPIR